MRLHFLFLLLAWGSLKAQSGDAPVRVNTTARTSTATIHFSLAHSKATSCELDIPEFQLMRDFLKKGMTVMLDSLGSGNYTFVLDKPRFVRLYYAESDTSSHSRVYTFFLSPGDNLNFQADLGRNDDIHVSGKGASDNQPLVGAIDPYPETYIYTGDTLPDRAIRYVRRLAHRNDSLFALYLQRYHPTPTVAKAWKDNLDYSAAKDFYSFKENNKFGIQDAYKRHFDTWQRAQDSLFKGLSLDDGDAIVAPSYQALLGEYLLRTKEALWKEANEHPAAFYREWYDTTEAVGRKMFQADVQTLLQEKIINHYFKSPKVVEYLYAVLLEDALSNSNPADLNDIYNRFKERFPHSRYVSLFAPYVEDMVERSRQGLTDKMVFVTDTLRTLEDLLALVKGKTALVDMWGTWCSPCREELEKNADSLHAYFNGKGVQFVYIANHDLEHRDQWKKLIAYFRLEGMNILASDELTKDIMKKIKGTGYPTNLVIHKDGTYELARGGYPLQRELLEKQLNEAL